MKLFKRLMAVMFAISMLFGMGTRVAAEEETTYTITINKDTTDKAAHTYGAYQLFKGRLETVEGKDVLSDIEWGDNVDTSKIIEELKKISDFSTLANNASAATVAKAISDKNYTNDSAGAQALADAFAKALKESPKGTVTIAAGATQGTINGLPAGYYLVKDTAAVTGEGSQTRYILEVVKNVEVTEKGDVPSVIKKVKEKNDTTGNETDWQDAADYDIGDAVPYKLEGTLPSKFLDYDTYKVYTFTDTLSKGLTAPNAFTVNLVDTDGAVVGDITSSFEMATANYAGTDTKYTGGKTLTISLKSGVDLRTLKIGERPIAATDKIVVTYEAVLNENAKLGSEGNPNEVYLEFTNNPNGEQNGEKGTTPTDKVIVFTYEIKANKVKEDNKPLSGAGFTLFKKVPAGTQGAVDGYLQIGNEITGVTTFEFKGVDAGEYKLVETTVPPTYNKAEDIMITVKATYDTDSADPQLKTLTVEPATAGFTATLASGIIEGNIVNKQGSTLPSTGGIGTTIFYVLGGLLVIGSGIVLVARRKASE